MKVKLTLTGESMSDIFAQMHHALDRVGYFTQAVPVPDFEDGEDVVQTLGDLYDQVEAEKEALPPETPKPAKTSKASKTKAKPVEEKTVADEVADEEIARVAEAAAPAEEKVDPEKLRAAATSKLMEAYNSGEAGRDEVKALLQSMGVARFSEIPAEKNGDLLDRANEIHKRHVK